MDIFNIYSTREKAKAVMEMQKQAERPMLSDPTLLPRIYGVFRDSQCMSGFRPKAFTRDQVLLFVVLYMYSPGSLFGDKLPGGMRKEIARAMNIRAESVVSDRCKDLFFVYTQYGEFREKAEELYREVCEDLGI